MATDLTRDPLAPSWWEEGCQSLVRLNPAWKALIVTHSDRALRSRGKPFETLARSLVGQQISVKAADAVWARLLNCVGQDCRPELVLEQSVETLRACGLSQRKAEYILSVAQYASNGGLDTERLLSMDDAEISTELCKIKGIGPWTAQMFLIFGLLRPDVWPVDDLGIQKGISREFMGGEAVDRQLALQFGQPLSPWRTVACWYLWRSLDPQIVDY